MRLWSIHPKYLDAAGLVALWREALLAQAVLRGETRGYTHHPQLERFRADPHSIGAYLREVWKEATRRGYAFDRSRIRDRSRRVKRISVNAGQVAYEWQHLLRKLRKRNPAHFRAIRGVDAPELHPLFRMRRGGVESWEKR